MNYDEFLSKKNANHKNTILLKLGEIYEISHINMTDLEMQLKLSINNFDEVFQIESSKIQMDRIIELIKKELGKSN